MSACVFDSPELTTFPTGALVAPTFAFDTSNTKYLGLAGSFVSGVFQGKGTACSFPTRFVSSGTTSTYAITPIIVTTSGTTPKTILCNVLRPSSINSSFGGSTTYASVECPSAINNQFAPGTYTLRFEQPNVSDVPKIAPHVFRVISPTWSTNIATDIVLVTETKTALPTSTATITRFTSVSTVLPSSASDQPTDITVTSTSSTTITNTESCYSSNSPPSPPATLASSSITAGNTTLSAQIPEATLKISLDGKCGERSGQTCLGSTFGDCCSSYGFCGKTDVYCQATEGCQSGFGSCLAPSIVSSSALPTSTIKVSLDGSCGEANGYICRGSGFGDCCSPYGWCGSLQAHCGAGCQLSYGSCNASTSATGTAPLPSSTLKVSLDGACGGMIGQTCLGSDFGICCSSYGYCGNTEIYCLAGCQAEFGTCSPTMKRSLSQVKDLPVKLRAIGGAGPDYTYPPIPTITIRSVNTQTVTVTTIPRGSNGIATISQSVYTIATITVNACDLSP